MALGVPGTGPYGEIRSLRNEIKDCKYEISLIEQGFRRPHNRSWYEQRTKESRAKIREILRKQKEYWDAQRKSQRVQTFKTTQTEVRWEDPNTR